MNHPFDRLADPAFIAEHRLPPASDHRWFAPSDDGASSFEQSLNGTWKLHFATNLAGTLPEYWAADTSGWDDVPVPAHLQMLGYDRPQYVNMQYPWDGLRLLLLLLLQQTSAVPAGARGRVVVQRLALQD